MGDEHETGILFAASAQQKIHDLAGGLFVEGLDGDRCEIDDITGPGDAVFVDARLTHGVDRIDPDAEVDWLSFQGRWSMLIATNKVASNEAVPNAVDLGDAS